MFITCTEGWDETTPIPMCEHLAAVIQKTIVDHISLRTQRALYYARIKRPDILTLVSINYVE